MLVRKKLILLQIGKCLPKVPNLSYDLFRQHCNFYRKSILLKALDRKSSHLSSDNRVGQFGTMIWKLRTHSGFSWRDLFMYYANPLMTRSRVNECDNHVQKFVDHKVFEQSRSAISYFQGILLYFQNMKR